MICFRRGATDNMDEIVNEFKSELFSYSYEKIWKELTTGDRELVRAISDKEELKRGEVLKRLAKPTNYSVYRDRLIKRGVISARQGYISLALPYFGDYVREYCG